MDISNGTEEVASTIEVDLTSSTELTDSGELQRRKRKGDDNLIEETKVPVAPTRDERVTVPMEEYINILLQDRKVAIRCDAHGCTKEFKTTGDYNDHYVARHLYKCGVCRRSLPGSYFLELHVLENHDTFFEVMAERQPMYSCLVEECELKFKSPSERYTHFHQDHKDYDLYAVGKRYEELHTVQPPKDKGNKDKKAHNQKSSKKNMMDIDPTVGTESINSDATIQTDISTGETEASEAVDDQGNKSGKKKTPEKKKPVHITFGHHVPKFRYWSEGKHARPPVVNDDTMDMSTVKESLDLTETSASVPEN